MCLGEKINLSNLLQAVQLQYTVLTVNSRSKGLQQWYIIIGVQEFLDFPSSDIRLLILDDGQSP